MLFGGFGKGLLNGWMMGIVNYVMCDVVGVLYEVCGIWFDVEFDVILDDVLDLGYGCVVLCVVVFVGEVVLLYWIWCIMCD